MPHIKFNWIDVVFVTILFRIGYIGFKNGILPEFFRLAGLFSAFIFSFNNYTLIGRLLSNHARWSSAKSDVIAFLFIFLAVLFIFKLIAMASGALLGSKDIASPSRAVGLVLGSGRGILLISLIYTLFTNSPFEYLSQSAGERSFSSRYISGIAPSVYRAGISFYPWEKVETPLAELLKK